MKPLSLRALSALTIWVLMLTGLGASTARAQPPPNAPKDQPQPITQQQMSEQERAIAPYIARARATYPDARARFLGGLPPGQRFFVVTRLTNPNGKWEQVFIRVRKIENGQITGSIASEITLVTGFRAGDSYTFNESELVDWLISHPDGSEEGNLVGKYLDSHQQK